MATGRVSVVARDLSVFGAVLVAVLALGWAGARAGQEASGLGPEMTAYIGFIEAEQAELQHLFDEGEVPADEYRVAKDRLAATLEAALRVGRSRDEDVVPDLYVLRETELTQVLPTGTAALKGKRPGDHVDESWIFHGKIRKREVFYILERTGGNLNPTGSY
jgi:hypothetical protein